MELPPELPMIAAAALAAGAVQGAMGFGFGLVALSGAALVLPVPEAVPLVACLGLWVYGSLLFVLRRDLHLRDGGPLLLGLLGGVPVGIALLRFGEPTLLLAALGAVLLLGTVFQTVGGPPKAEAGPRWGLAAGLASGVLSGSLGTPGPPALLYVSSQPWSPARVTACMQLLLGSAAAAQLVGYAASGMLSAGSLRLAAGCIPAAVVGLGLGQTVFKRLPEVWFRRIVRASLAALGVFFLVRGLP